MVHFVGEVEQRVQLAGPTEGELSCSGTRRQPCSRPGMPCFSCLLLTTTCKVISLTCSLGGRSWKFSDFRAIVVYAVVNAERQGWWLKPKGKLLLVSYPEKTGRSELVSLHLPESPPPFPSLPLLWGQTNHPCQRQASPRVHQNVSEEQIFCCKKPDCTNRQMFASKCPKED